MLQGANAVASLMRHVTDIDALVGEVERDRYIDLVRDSNLHVLDIDQKGIMVFHDQDQGMQIDLVVGKPGTIAEISRLRDVAKKIGYHRIEAKTSREGLRRIYKRHGMVDVGCRNGEYKMALELEHE